MSQSFYAIGIDFGTHNIGLAVGQSITGTASPLITLKFVARPSTQPKQPKLAKQKKPAHAQKILPWEQLLKILDEWQPKHIVIGLPLGLDGEEQAITKKTRQFAKQLASKLVASNLLIDPQPEVQAKPATSIHLIDERYTSQAAEAFHSKKQPKNKQGHDRDAFAAVLILESWFAQDTTAL